MIVKALRSVALAALVLALAHCSDDTKPTADSGPMTLWPCSEPGKSCNAHDVCAINPVCGQDGLCHPEGRQNCDDGLECTADTCGAAGQCVNTPKEGTCALPDPGGSGDIRCFADGAKHPTDPCKSCDSKTSPTKWGGANGGGCDDGNACTKDDYCQAGVCGGTYFGNACNDSLECTEDICDGAGGCSHKQKSTHCLIGGKCYKDKETDATGCQLCDVSKDQYKWSTVADLCKIGGLCFKPGVTDASGCGVCDPKNPTSWSPAPGTCFVDGACKKSGDKDPTTCGSCDPTKSATGWTVAAGKCLISGACVATGDKSPSGCSVCDPSKSPTAWSVAGTAQQTAFEGSLGGYTVSPASGVTWQLSTKRAHAGAGSLYYGDPAKGSYDSGSAPNSGSATSAAVTLPAGKAALQFWLWADVETIASSDVLTVKVNSTVVWAKDATTMPPATSYRTWVRVEVNLAAFAGQSVQVSFGFDTKDAWANGGEGIYIDDVAIVTGC